MISAQLRSHLMSLTRRPFNLLAQNLPFDWYLSDSNYSMKKFA